MASRSLHSTEDRLTVWRDTIQLFHRYRVPAFVGPFKQLGFRYRVAPEMLTREGELKQPDIVASGASGWAIVEVTADQKSKDGQLESYRTIDPRYLGSLGLEASHGTPDTMSSRLAFIDDGDHCQILLLPLIEVRKPEKVANVSLRAALLESVGINLTKLPSIPFTIVPESVSKGRELRRGISACVLQTFAPKCQGVRILDMIDASLERLSDKVSVKAKHALIDAARDHLRVLVSEFLPDELEMVDDVLRVKLDVKIHIRSLERINTSVRAWIAQIPGVTLDRFG